MRNPDVRDQPKLAAGADCFIVGVCGETDHTRLWHFSYLPSSAASSSTAEFQSPGERCRNNFMVGYHGESDLSNIHRQSASQRRNTHTLRPKAPAKCASIVSAVINRSIFKSSAAASITSGLSPDMSWISLVDAQSSSSARCGARWKL